MEGQPSASLQQWQATQANPGIPPGLNPEGHQSQGVQEDFLAEFKKMKEELLQLKKSNEDWYNTAAEEDMLEDSEGGEHVQDLTWNSVLRPLAKEAVTTAGVGLCSLLAAPPPLEQLRLSEKQCQNTKDTHSKEANPNQS